MKSPRLHPFLVLLLAWAVASSIHGLPARAASNSPPTKLSHQGFLTDGAGAPLGPTNAPVNTNVVFRIFKDPTGGSSLWASSQSVTVDSGYFSVILGEGSAVGSEPFPDLATVFSGSEASDRYLELTVGSATLSPRLRFLAAPYALLATKAMTVDANTTLPAAQVSGTLHSTNIPNLNASIITAGSLGSDRIPALNADKITEGTLGAARIPSLNASKITDGTFADARLSANVARLNTEQSFTATNTFTGEIRLGSTPSNVKRGTLNGWLEVVSAATGPQPGHLRFMLDATEKGSLGVAAADNGFSKDAKQGDLVLRASGTNNLILRSGATPADTTPALTITSDNKVGIGTTTPGKALLEVTTGVKRSTRSLEAYMRKYVDNNELNSSLADTDKDTADTSVDLYTSLGAGATFDSRSLIYGPWNTTGATNSQIDETSENYAVTGIYCDAWIGTKAGLITESDQRIKQVIGLSDPRADLEAVRKLRVTDYRLVDPIPGDYDSHKGVIAQEVEQVIPAAVKRSRSVVPDLYAPPVHFAHSSESRTLRLKLAKAHGLKGGEQVRLVTDASTAEFKVSAVIDEKEFTVEGVEDAPRWVFVYGRQVDDFRSVDYDQLFTTGLGAIQELARENDALRRRVEDLESRTAQVAALERRLTELDRLQRQVADLQTAFRKPASNQATDPLETASVETLAVVRDVPSR